MARQKKFRKNRAHCDYRQLHRNYTSVGLRTRGAINPDKWKSNINLAGLDSCHLYDIHQTITTYYPQEVSVPVKLIPPCCEVAVTRRECKERDEGVREKGNRPRPVVQFENTQRLSALTTKTKNKRKNECFARITSVCIPRASRPLELRRSPRPRGKHHSTANVDLEHLCKFIRGICNTLGRHFDKPLRFTFYSRTRDPEVDEIPRVSPPLSLRTSRLKRIRRTNDSYKTLGIEVKRIQSASERSVDPLQSKAVSRKAKTKYFVLDFIRSASLIKNSH